LKNLSVKQAGVLKGIVIGLTISFAVVLMGIFQIVLVIEPDLSVVARLELAQRWSLLPAAFLIVSIARLAKHRFFHPADIDGGAGFSEDSERAKFLQSLLQNTLEQCVIAIAGYLAWAVIMPGAWISVVPLSACAFAVGRILFFNGYLKGAPARALGFSLTFYPTVLLYIFMVFEIGRENFSFL
jgi:hypothetical protein